MRRDFDRLGESERFLNDLRISIDLLRLCVRFCVSIFFFFFFRRKRRRKTDSRCGELSFATMFLALRGKGGGDGGPLMRRDDEEEEDEVDRGDKRWGDEMERGEGMVGVVVGINGEVEEEIPFEVLGETLVENSSPTIIPRLSLNLCSREDSERSSEIIEGSSWAWSLSRPWLLID